jgi:hypothetical protein
MESGLKSVGPQPTAGAGAAPRRRILEKAVRRRTLGNLGYKLD